LPVACFILCDLKGGLYVEKDDTEKIQDHLPANCRAGTFDDRSLCHHHVYAFSSAD
jgi:hypothetical protein